MKNILKIYYTYYADNEWKKREGWKAKTKSCRYKWANEKKCEKFVGENQSGKMY